MAVISTHIGAHDSATDRVVEAREIPGKRITQYEFNRARRLFGLIYKNISYNTLYTDTIKRINSGNGFGFNPVEKWSADGRGDDSRKFKMLKYMMDNFDHASIESAIEFAIAQGNINVRFRDGGGRGATPQRRRRNARPQVSQPMEPQRSAQQERDDVQEALQRERDRLERERRQRESDEARARTETPRVEPQEIIIEDNVPNPAVHSQHVQYPTLLAFVRSGFPVWIPGPAGSGKTTAAMHVARDMELPFHFNGAVDTEYKLLGFTDAGGRFHETPFYRAYKDGGIYLFDEVDASNPQAMVALNAALENGHCVFGNGECIAKHENFHVIAAANTYGSGATHEYVGRNKLDAATVDRFIMLEWQYDEALERYIAGNDEWVRYVQCVRAAVKSAGIKHVVSPRASIRGAKLLSQGIARGTVINATVRKGLSDDQWRAVEMRVQQ